MNNRDSLRERHTSIHSNDQLSTLTSSNLLVCLFTSPPDGPQCPSVSVSPSAEMLEGGSVTLTCSTDANPAAKYTWYKAHQTSDPHLLSKEPHLVFSSIQSSDSGWYFYGPQRPSVSVSPSAEMLEGDSVTLTCSTDANPAANYTWYKEHEDSPRASGQIFPITNFTAKHSGNYYCEAQNEMGRSTSTLRLITSSGGPADSPSPSAASDNLASPSSAAHTLHVPIAANYTWYKQDGTSDPRLLSEEPHLVFSSIQSSDSGNYSCTAENQLGRKTSDFISIDVKYGPQRPSVSVSPSAEMLEGGSVNLTCSTDANPAAKYTWYKEHEDSPRASGQIFTITDFTAEHSGNYYCEAQNEMGRSNSTLLLITESGEFLHDRNRLINKQHLLHVYP
uniref:Ig-like domain-containing protein n=1 Tax=Gasterosteus aculeatus aculeatus TaxID=481459 RepID=A0AAQ4PH09_GASAC